MTKTASYIAICIGLMLGPLVLTGVQILEYIACYSLVFPSREVDFPQLFRQYHQLIGQNWFYAMGGVLGGLSGALLTASRQRNRLGLRLIKAASLLAGVVIVVWTVFIDDPESGFWGVGAPGWLTWSLRILFNSALKWWVLLMVTESVAIKQLTREASRS